MEEGGGCRPDIGEKSLDVVTKQIENGGSKILNSGYRMSVAAG